MRIKEKRARKKFLFPLVAKLRKFDVKGKYLSHTYFYRVAGEDLPERHENRTRAKIIWSILSAILVFTLIIYIATLLLQLTNGFSNGKTINLFEKNGIPKINFLQWDLLSLSSPMRLFLSVVSVGFGVYIGFKIDYRLHSITDGQKGDSRLLTLKETKQLCKEVPDRSESFKGIGGIPFSHFENKLYIDTDTVNTCFVGTSRSGKGQMAVFSLIDNLSRAEIKSSMILNDPKTELFTASKETLEKRGYDVLAYNVLDPLSSMSDNPLSLIIKYWKRGDIDTATELTNTFTHTIYYDPNAGDNKYFNENAEKAVNALIFTLLENADKHGSYKKVTPNNIVELLTEIGSLNYKIDPEDFNEKNALDEFMSSLPTGNIAKKQYGSTKMGSDKARGNILSTALTGLNPFTLPKVAKMTTLSSLEYKSLGFPKYLDVHFLETYANKRIKVNFYHKKKLIHKERLKVEYGGFAELNFDCTLQSNDVIEFVYEEKGTIEKARYTFKRVVQKDENGQTVYRKETGKETLPELEKYAEMIPQEGNTLTVESVKCHYSEKPVALFLLTPDFNSSNHVLVSILLKQIYTELSTQCVKTRGDKCHRRIHYILDEFGNMPTIADMDNIMTVTAGRNMLWDIFVQSYAQIFAKYGDDTGTTIKENCQTHIYIMSTNDDTIEEFSKKVGHRTVQQEQAQTNHFGMNSSITRTPDQERVLTPERIQDFLEGETLVLRKLKRRDNSGRKVRPFSIFNTKKTSMPYAYQYLDEFNNGGDIQDIDIDSKHLTLNLADYQLDYEDFLVDEEAKIEYMRQKVQSA